MGAWGTGIFENDAADCWLGELEQSKPNLIDETLDQIDAEMDVDQASTVLAAAEVVASARGHRSPATPDVVSEWLARVRWSPDRKVTTKAIEAIQALRQSSELAELWAEPSDASDNIATWEKSLADLMHRLDVDAVPIAVTPHSNSKTTKIKKRKVKAAAGDILAIPLPEGRFGFAKVIFVGGAVERTRGAIFVRAFDYRGNSPTLPTEVQDRYIEAVEAVFTSGESIHSGMWLIVGNRPVTEEDMEASTRTFGLDEIWGGDQFLRARTPSDDMEKLAIEVYSPPLAMELYLIAYFNGEIPTAPPPRRKRHRRAV